MESDFQLLREVIGDPLNPKSPIWPKSRVGKKASPPKRVGLTDAILWLIHRLQPVSMFRVHKLLYLAEVECREVFGVPFMSIYFIRQKDGPFAPEVTRAIEFLRSDLTEEFKTAAELGFSLRHGPKLRGLSQIQLDVLE
jgi:hypothetical protein